MQTIFAIVELYISPAIFAIGLVFFFYGIINYFIMGPGDEGRREVGRQTLLWAALFFLLGFLVFGVSSWLFDFADRLGGSTEADVERPGGILPIPNVPTR